MFIYFDCIQIDFSIHQNFTFRFDARVSTIDFRGTVECLEALNKLCRNDKQTEG